jgi:hypothetical protein
MSSLRLTLLLLVMVLLNVASGCDNSLEPLDTETGIFAIYGFLDLNKENHYIRVRDLNVPFTREATETIDATVTLHNLTLGSSTLLESERRAHQDVYQHNFLFSDSVFPDHEYRLVIERSDGVTVEANTRTPTMPEPVTEPMNQNCFVPIEFSKQPMNGGTIVLRVGLGPTENSPWGAPQVLRPDSQGRAAFTFIPDEQVSLILPGSGLDRRCGDHLFAGNVYLSYIHFAPGFYEQTAPEIFDIFDSTLKFGALYYDTLAVPVDTSPVCPPDC